LMRNIICRQRATDWMYSLFCGSKQKLKFTFSRNRHYVFSYINVQKSTDFKPQEKRERKTGHACSCNQLQVYLLMLF
jgi:hypothetical protein